LFPDTVQIGSKVLFFNLGEAESKNAFALLQELRQSGIAGELFHEQSKFDKQFKYAEKKNIPFAIIIGSKEMENGTCVVKDLQKGTQEEITQASLVAYFNKADS
jgi:histidyl-tRNA synthetase